MRELWQNKIWHWFYLGFLLRKSWPVEFKHVNTILDRNEHKFEKCALS